MTTRTFNGRQSEELYSPEIYKLFEVMKNILDEPMDPSIGPVTTREGALWLDTQTANGDLKYFSEGEWRVIFGDRFKMTGDVLSANQPDSPIKGQFWLSDGILMYYDGVGSWLPVKAVNVDTQFNSSAFEQFLLINPMPVVGGQIIDYEDLDHNGTKETLVYKSQFLLPSVEMDKFFINGTHTKDYEVMTNIAIQYPSERLQGKYAAAVHVNPKNLVNITKKLIAFDKINPVVSVTEQNTEYYGFRQGLGHLLLKSNEAYSEYFSVPQGIQLSPTAAAAYDYVLAVTYAFKDARTPGILNRNSIMLSGTNSIYIGTVNDPIAVFVQGLYYDEDVVNYTYESVNGFLNLSTLETKMDIGVISFPKKEVGTITSLDVNLDGIITMTNTYNHPIVFVYGETMNILADYTQGTGEDINKLYVKNALPGMRYAVAETWDNINDTAQMWVKAGITTGNSIECSLAEMPGDVLPILFVDGILVSQRDIVRDPVTGAITCNGLVSGMDYTLLQDPAERLIFNDYVSFSTIPIENASKQKVAADSVIVYAENQLLCDASTVSVTSLPATGIPGEIKLLVNATTNQWYKCSNSKVWEPILDTPSVTKLNGTALSYSTSKKSISLLQNFGAVDCTYYAYNYANAVEEPLLKGTMVTNGTDTDYKIAFSHTYPLNKNSLSIWINGVRQYPNTSLDPDHPNGIVEVDASHFRLPEPIAGNLLYVIERPEKTELRSCEREVLTVSNRIADLANAYQTNIPLFPGNLRVFIGGLRQPPSAYKILDAYTIMMKDPIIGSMDNFPVETVDVGGNTIEVTHTIADKILIEVRQDYNLRESTHPIRYSGQNEWYCADVDSVDIRQGGDALPKAVLDSKDFIMIYINGLAYGREYAVIQDTESIKLTNQFVTADLGVDSIDQYFRNNPDKYLLWQKKNGYEKYQAKPIEDKIIFEWR